MSRRPFVLIGVLALLIAPPARAQMCPNGYAFDSKGNPAGCAAASTVAQPPAMGTPGSGGIFSCSAPGATSIAASSAIGGTFVPVYDAAVALNTGTLAYKDCVLKELANQEKQAATAAYVSNEYTLLATGRGGNPRWVVNYYKELGDAGKQAVTNTFDSGIYRTISPVFQREVETALARNYQYATEAPGAPLFCPYQGDLSAVLGGTTNDVWGGLGALINPACSPYSSYLLAQNQLDANVAAAQNQWLNQLNWSHGIYSVTDNGRYDGNVVVPGVFLDAVGTQALTSGFRQLENANDIGEMVGSFFAGIGAKLLSGPSSVASVQQYFGQAVAQQQGSLVNSVVGTAVTNLNQILNWEQGYNGAERQMSSTVTGAISQLRSAEGKCWDLIIARACTASSTQSASAAKTCTAPGGAALHLATSTNFSDSVIRSGGFADIAQTLSQQTGISDQNLATLNTILTAIQSTDATTRNTGLAQLDTIVSANPPVLHTQQNVIQVEEQLRQLQSTVSDPAIGLVPTALHRWAGDDSQGGTGVVSWSGDPGSDAGWCNVNSQQTVGNWQAAWTK